MASASSNIEQVIHEHAAMMAEQMVKVVEWVRSEEDIHHASNTLIDEFIQKAGLTVKERHEYAEVPNVKHSYRLLYDRLGDKAFEFFAKAFENLTPKAKESATSPKGLYDASRKP